MIKTAVIIGLTILVLIVLVESQNLDDEIDDEEYSDSPVKEYIEDELEEEEFFDEEEDFDPNLFERDSDGVLILNPDNFATAIQLYDFLLVHFYKEYCDGCEVFSKDFGLAARNLTATQSHVVCAKMDLTNAPYLYEVQDIPRELPHVKLYRDGIPTEYTSGPLADQIIKWLDRKAYQPIHEAFDLTVAQNLLNEFPIAVFAFLDETDGEHADIIAKIADDLFEYQFIVTDKREIFKHYGAEVNTVIIFKHDEHEKVIKYDGEIEYESLRKWVAVHAVSLIPELIDEESVKLIFGSEYDNFLWLMLSKKAGHFDKYLPAARRVAKDYREKVMFVVVNTDIDDKLNILELLRMDKNEVPTMRIVRLANGIEKFRPETTLINEGTIREFVDKYMRDEGYLYTYGDQPVKDWDKMPVKELVTSNFDSFVYEHGRNVFVEFYAPGCGACKKVEPIFESVAKLYEHARHIELARVNMDKNDIKDFAIMMYPTFKFINSTNHVIGFNDQPSFKNFERFIDKHAVGCSTCWKKNEAARVMVEVKDEL